MVRIVEGSISLEFPDGWQAAKIDDWAFYRNQFQLIEGACFVDTHRCTQGTRAVDVAAIEPGRILWLIELKDYRRHQRTKAISIAEEVATKARDSLAAMAAGRVRANNENERDLSAAAMQARSIRVVLHLEQPATPSRLFPRAIDPASVKQRLRQIIRGIDSHALVIESSEPGDVPWAITLI